MALPKTIISAMPGATLGRYKLGPLLGEGGMGRVFKSRDAKKRRPVAIKVLNATHAGNEEMVKRFLREAKVINEIDHQNIVEVYDVGRDNGHVYCVMEFLEGEPLERVLSRKRPVKLARALEILLAVARALEAAHERGVVHRDLKPDNIFLLKKATASGVRVKVLDFGIAKLLDGNATRFTAQGFILGTPSYMSLEQASGMEVDHRTDVYSFGVVAFRLLSGKLPHTFSTYGEMLASLNGRTPKLPNKTPGREAIPEPLAKLVSHCLSKEPKDRPQSFSEVCAVLEKVSASLKPTRRPRKRQRSRFVGLLVKAAVVAALAGAGYVYREPIVQLVETWAPKAKEQGQRLIDKVQAFSDDSAADDKPARKRRERGRAGR